MNFKKTAIAVAVATVAATPILASADGSVYASARYGFETQDAGGTSERVNQFKNFGSRWGIKGDTDLGNGLTAFGHYEAHMFDVAKTATNSGDLRDFKIGVRGGFGEVYMGDGIDHAWDTFMTTDGTWWYGGQSHLFDGVQSNAITYMGNFGPVSLGVTAQMKPEANNANEESVDTFEIAGAFDAGVVNIAVGISDAKTSPTDTEAVVGFVVSGAAAGFTYAVDYQMQDAPSGSNADRTSLQLEGGFANFYAQYGMQETDGSNVEPTNLVLGYTHSIGPRTLMYFEYHSADPDTAGSDSTDTIAAVLKYDIL